MAVPTYELSLDDRYLVEDGQVYLTGTQALVRLALDQMRADRRADRRTASYISGYEGSPLAGYDLELGRQAELLRRYDVVHQPGVNEELAATAVEGSQLAAVATTLRPDGVVGYWYGKAPGLDRATDAIRHANLIGTHPTGGVLALVGDDPTAKSSTVPSGSEFALADLAMPTLYPADSQDILDLGLHGVALSRASGLWVGFKIATNVADSASTAIVHPDRIVPVVPTGPDGTPYVHQPSAKLMPAVAIALERSIHEVRLKIASDYAMRNGLNRVVRGGTADRIGLVAAGKAYLDLCQALGLLGLDEAALERYGIRILKLGMVYPLEPQAVAEFVDGLDEVVVVEEKRSFVEAGLKDLLYGRVGAPAIHGKTDADGRQLLTATGELDPDVIARAVGTRLLAHAEIPSVTAWLTGGRRTRERITLPLLPRTPYFCSGCPHNSSTKVPDGALVGGGIGCHAMVLGMDESAVGDVIGLTQMGGEGGHWIGMAPFVEPDHFVQNLGDGTFTHSGSLAVRAAVAAGVNVTFKLLYNSAVAMTGGQQPAGVLPVPRLAQLLLAEGVARVVVTTEEPERYRGVRLPAGVRVHPREKLVELQTELAGVAGVTVLIHDQECAAQKRRKRKRGKADRPATRVLINERVCEGCGDCGAKSNCLSVQPIATEFGRKTQIHQPSCNTDLSCLDGDCPSFVTVVAEEKPATRRRVAVPNLSDAELPEPVVTVPTDRFAMRITGVGGTGVVTLAQVIATAGVLAGRHVRSLDQTGLAQKGGAVVSDVKLSGDEVDLAAKLSAGECDLYLGCDLLVGADSTNLTVAAPDRTVAVLSTAQTPTGRMISDPDVRYPEVRGLMSRVDAVAAEVHELDARRLAEALFGDDQFANVLLAGAAYQVGAIPLPAESIEAAIRLNGAAAEANIQAFRRGRQAICDPAGLTALVGEQAGLTPAAAPDDAGSELARLLDIRIPELVAYQNAGYARPYAELVENVRKAEDATVPGSTALAEAVARNLYKLMAYKDEYEVARLSLDPGLAAEIARQFGPGAKHAWRLHPPALRALGMRRKISLGAWARPVFAVLRGMRRLRGTPLDVFGYTEVRRTERALVGEYRAVVSEVLAELRADNHPLAVEIAGLPDLVRGYEHIKLRNVATYRERLAELTAELRGGSLSSVAASR